MPSKVGYKKKRVFRKKARKGRKGLNKVQKKQVSTIINAKAESKYMNTSYNLQGQSFKKQSTTLASQEIVVRGFHLGDGKINGVAGTYGYNDDDSARPLTAMNTARTFQTDTTNASYKSMIPDGKYCSPSLCKATWRIHRSMVDSLDADDVRETNPYVVRMIRVRPRALKYSGATIVPSVDLFVNNYGVACGIDSPSNEYQKNFGPFEMMTSKVNARKYEVIQDIQFQLEPPISTTVLNMDYITSIVNPRNQKLLTTYHKMPKKLFYDGAYDNAVNVQPNSPQSSELVFFHCAVLGTNVKSLAPKIEIDCKPISSFKDI